MHWSVVSLILCLALATVAVADEPGPDAVYLEYHERLKQSYSFESVFPYFTLERRQRITSRFPASMRDTAFSLQKSSAPETVEVVFSEIEGNNARLDLSGRSGHNVFAGEAVLRREGGNWLINQVSWRER